MNSNNLLEYNNNLGGDSGVFIASVCADIEITARTVHQLNQIRSALIEQIAFTQHTFRKDTLYTDIASTAFLQGQLTLVTILLQNIPTPEGV